MTFGQIIFLTCPLRVEKVKNLGKEAGSQPSRAADVNQEKTVRVGRAYENHSWVILSAIGILIIVGGAPHALGYNTDPLVAENIIGKTLTEFQTSNPGFFDLYDYFFRSGGWSDMAFGFLVFMTSSTAYRRGERGAWYTLLSVPVFFLGHAAITLNVGSAASDLIPFLTTFIALSLLGLILPIRRFFPTK